MLHLGDIAKINGAEVPAVNVIIGGSPCQDLSVAGKRAGLSGERSGLFMEQLRIIKEMRRKDIENGAVIPRPRYMVWENVPGAFSSNKGEDFRIVLEETAKAVEPTAAIPRPDKGKWTNAGAVMGDGWSIAWRVFDAQFWGVPQRRRRIALVADFGGESAPEILFERKGLSGDSEESGTAWEKFTTAIAKRFGSTNQAERGTEHLSYCMQGNSMDRADTAGCNGKGVKEGASYTLNTIDRPAVYDYDRRHDKCQEVEVAPTVTAKYGTGGGNTPLVYDARGNGDGKTVPTITGDHENRITDYTALCVRERCGCDGGRKGVLIQDEKSGTISANKDQFVIAIDRAAFNQDIDCENSEALGVNYQKTIGALCADDYKGINNQYVSQDKVIIDTSVSISGFNVAAFSFDSLSSNSMKSNNPNSGCRQVDVAKTIDTTTPDPSKNQGGNAIVNNSTVRRLTPLECERLQGFPDGWTDIGDYIDTNGKKRKTSDSARYKALGNSIALPSWVWVLERLSYRCGADRTMASLFDGIGGFPLIWETLNGQGTCLWASEIEEFPIAVTKRRFS